MNKTETKASKSTVWRTLQRAEHLQFQNMQRVSQLLQRHKDARLEFCRNNMNRDWNKVRWLFFTSFFIFRHFFFIRSFVF